MNAQRLKNKLGNHFYVKLREKEKLEAKLEFHVFKSMEPKH